MDINKIGEIMKCIVVENIRLVVIIVVISMLT